MVPDDPHPLQNGAVPEAELAFGHFLVPRRADGSLWELGRGAMGVTYRAFDTSLQTEVALKVIRADRVSEDVARRRFQREARSAAKVRHPNIASVLYLGEQGGEFYYAMEFVPGQSLADLLRETNGPLPPAVAVALAAQAAAALNAAHKKELIHRDLKPQNLMLLEGEHLDHADERTRAAGDRLLEGDRFRVGAFLRGGTQGRVIGDADEFRFHRDARLRQPRAGRGRGRSRRPLGPLQSRDHPLADARRAAALQRAGDQSVG